MERTEPPHTRRRKREAEYTCWLRRDLYEIEEALSHHPIPHLWREACEIISDHFDLIMGEWEKGLGAEVMRVTEPRTASAIETTPEALVLVLGERKVRPHFQSASDCPRSTGSRDR